MCCVACMIDASACRVKCAVALLLISRSKKMQGRIRTCVCFIEVSCVFKYGLYMFCVACMRFAHAFAVRFAIALLLTSRKNKMQET